MEKKAMDRGDQNRYLRKELARIKKERDALKKGNKEAQKRLQELEASSNEPVGIHNKLALVYMTLLLFHVARISFRAVSRVLGVLTPFLGLQKAPCHQTVINWVDRLALTRVQNTVCRLRTKASAGLIWMIDISIALGGEKILAILAINADHHKDEKAPDLKSSQCIAIGISVSWTGEMVADFLEKVMDVAGHPAALLKDAGTELARAERLLAERGRPVSCIDDVSHVSANILKREYAAHPLFNTFISACGNAAKKLKQTVLACLAPPKVSTKARFMNLHRLVKWADKLLKHSPKGRAPKGSLLEKLRKAMGLLPECKPFIRRFHRDASTLLKCQKILKNEGLTYKTAEECKTVIKAIPASSSVRVEFTAWMKKQLAVAENIGAAETGLPVSSDTIESLFGVGKVHGAGKVKDARRIGIRLPAMCGRITLEDARHVLDMSVKEQQELMGSPLSLIGQRRKILPNPGSLDLLLSEDENREIDLIPRSKNRSKNEKNNVISIASLKDTGPQKREEDILIFCPEGRPSSLDKTA